MAQGGVPPSCLTGTSPKIWPVWGSHAKNAVEWDGEHYKIRDQDGKVKYLDFAMLKGTKDERVGWKPIIDSVGSRKFGGVYAAWLDRPRLSFQKIPVV